MNERSIKIGSICCGLGGFDLGCKNIGFETIWAIDIMKEACESFKLNFPNTLVLQKDAHTIDDFTKLGYVDGLIFGPPCQGFSIANTKRNSDDGRNSVYLATIKAVNQIQPKFFVFENVKGILSLKDKDNNLFFDRVLNDYAHCGDGYNLTWKLIDCSKVGVPQLNRYRVIIVGIRKDLDIKYAFPDEPYGDSIPLVTLRDTIYHLKDINQEGDYDKSGFSPMYLGRNRQKNWDEPSFTIEASGRQAKLHPEGGNMYKVDSNKWIIPESCRKLSSLECKLIQTFPEDFIVTGRLSKRYEQIGNAVPPRLAEHVCRPIFNMMQDL